MKNYLELALRKEKKPASIEKIIARIEKIKSEELNQEVHLTNVEKEEVKKLLNQFVSEYEVYQTPSDNYVLMFRTALVLGLILSIIISLLLSVMSWHDKKSNKRWILVVLNIILAIVTVLSWMIKIK